MQCEFQASLKAHLMFVVIFKVMWYIFLQQRPGRSEKGDKLDLKRTRTSFAKIEEQRE